MKVVVPALAFMRMPLAPKESFPTVKFRVPVVVVPSPIWMPLILVVPVVGGFEKLAELKTAMSEVRSFKGAVPLTQSAPVAQVAAVLFHV